MIKQTLLISALCLLLVLPRGDGAGAAPAPVEKPKPPLILRGHRYPVLHFAFSPDSKKLISGGLDRMVILWDVVKGEKIATLHKHATSVDSVAFSPDGKLVASAATFEGIDASIRVWDLVAGKVHALFEGRFGGVGCMRFSPDGKTLATATSGQIRLWDLSMRKQRAVFDLMTKAGLSDNAMLYTPAGKLLAATRELRAILFWDVEKQTKKRIEDNDSHGVGAFSSDGRILAGAANDEVAFWEVSTGKKLDSFKLSPLITRVAFSPDNKSLAVGIQQRDNSAVLRLVDVPTKKVFATWKRNRNAGLTFLFSPDGRTLAIAPSHENIIVLWQVPRRPQPSK